MKLAFTHMVFKSTFLTYANMIKKTPLGKRLLGDYAPSLFNKNKIYKKGEITFYEN